MSLRTIIDKFLDKYFPHPKAVVKPLTKRQIDYMPTEIYRNKLLTNPEFSHEAEAVLASSKVKYYYSDYKETREMVVDPKTTVRGFGS